MATTSLWHIQGHLKDLTDYVENPEKTAPALEDLFDASKYVQRPAATADGHYVTAINCLKETAVQQMILTKKQYGKTDGYIAYHGYQSFKPGEVSAQECHEIGVELAKEMWGDRFQIIVTTHLDKEHLHNHFCFNSVSFKDGKKYNYSKSEIQRLRDVSDRLCWEHGLDIICHPHKAPCRTVYFDEKSDKPTRYNIYYDDVWDAFERNRSPKSMENYLRALGYITDFSGAHWKIRLPQYQHFTRLDTLDKRLTPEFIWQNCGYRASFGNWRAEITHSPYMPLGLESIWQPYVRTSSIYKLYLYYSYELGMLPRKSDYKPTSPFLREDLRYLDRLDRETRFLAKTGIEKIEELWGKMDQVKNNIDDLIQERTHITYAMRRAPPEQKENLHKEKEELTAQIMALRAQLRLMQDIESRSFHMDETLTRVYESERYYELRESIMNRVYEERGLDR